MWQAQHDELGAHWPTAVATAHQACNSITAMAQAVLAQFEGELLLCGASMGGMVALEAIRLAPSRVRGLALLGTVAHPETPDMHQLRSDAIALFEQGRAEELIRANVALAFHPDHAGDLALTALYLDMVLDAGADTLIRHNRAVMARPDARTHLRRIDCPSLVLCGEADQLTPVEHSRVIATRHSGRQAGTDRAQRAHADHGTAGRGQPPFAGMDQRVLAVNLKPGLSESTDGLARRAAGTGKAAMPFFKIF